MVCLANLSISHVKHKVRIETTEKQNSELVWNGISSPYVVWTDNKNSAYNQTVAQPLPYNTSTPLMLF